MSRPLCEPEVERIASQLLREAVDAGRLPAAPAPESLARIARVIRPALLAAEQKETLSASTSLRVMPEEQANVQPAA